MHRLGILLLLSTFFYACEEKETSNTENIPFVRIDSVLMNSGSPEDVAAIFARFPFYTPSLYRAAAEDTALIAHVYSVVSHPETKQFYQEVLSGYAGFTALKQELGGAFARIEQIYPNFKPPKIYTTFTGLENDLYVSDSVIIISIEAFGGPSASYRPLQPDYILSRYDKPHIVPTITKLLAQSYIQQSQSSTLLNDMLYFGKTMEFAQEVLPDVPANVIMGYADSTMKATWYTQDLVWAYFVEKELFYEQRANVKEKYLGERPFITEIGPQAPGRLGQWLGWRIVQKFRTENPDLSLEEIMRFKDPEEFLRKSKYRGEIE